MIAIVGEVDAENAEEVTACVVSLLTASKQLLLDLSGLELLDAHMCFALQRVNRQCALRGISWVLVPSTAISRSLADCDSTGVLPTAETTAAALHILSCGPCQHLQRA